MAMANTPSENASTLPVSLRPPTSRVVSDNSKLLDLTNWPRQLRKPSGRDSSFAPLGLGFVCTAFPRAYARGYILVPLRGRAAGRSCKQRFTNVLFTNTSICRDVTCYVSGSETLQATFCQSAFYKHKYS